MSPKNNFNKNLLKGIIIEFYPKNYKSEFEGSNIEWKSKYIIPKRLNMDEIKYNDFLLKMFDEYKILYPEIYKDYYFNKIIYVLRLKSGQLVASRFMHC